MKVFNIRTAQENLEDKGIKHQAVPKDLTSSSKTVLRLQILFIMALDGRIDRLCHVISVFIADRNVWTSRTVGTC